MRSAASRGRTENGGGLMLAAVLACSTLSYMDRQVVSLVVGPLKASLGLSDTEVGLLQGLAFTLCYAVAGMPLAFAVDRLPRVRLAATVVALWSAATMACGLAAGFSGLLAARAATAVSESGFSPAALSLLADRVAPARIARVSALFLLGPPLGTGLALLAGGAVLHALELRGGLSLPGIGRLEPWQGLFVAVGLPGLPMAALLLLLREPVRTAAAIGGGDGSAGEGFVAALRRTGRFVVPYVAGTVLVMLVQFAYAAWAPSFFTRVWGLAPHRAGTLLGPIFIAASVAGALTSGLLARGADGAATLRRIVAVVLVGSAILAPAAVLLPFMPSLRSALLVYALLAFSFSLVAPLATAPLLLLMPSGLRGRFLATGGALLAIVGGGGGPLAVGLVTDRLFGREAALGHALALVSGVSAGVGLLVLLRARQALWGRAA